MKAKIEFEKVWFDEDIVELRILVSNGHSMFTNKVYVVIILELRVYIQVLLLTFS